MKRQEKIILIEKRYKVSRVLDELFIFLILVPIFSLWGLYSYDSLEYFVFVFCFVVFGYRYLGDKIFGNQSIGKKIMKIKIVSSNGKEIPPFSMIIKRRSLEWRNYDRCLFTKKRYDIDEMTSTKIVLDIKPRIKKQELTVSNDKNLNIGLVWNSYY